MSWTLRSCAKCGRSDAVCGPVREAGSAASVSAREAVRTLLSAWRTLCTLVLLLAGFATPCTAADCTLSAGGFITPLQASIIAQSAAWLEAVDHAASEHSSTAARLAAHEMPQRAALMAASLATKVWTDHFSADATSVTAHVTVNSDDQQDYAIRASLQCPDKIELEQTVLARLRPLVHDARKASQDSVTAFNRGAVTEAQMLAEQAQAAAHRIAALWQLQTLLPRYCTLWSEPEDTGEKLHRALEDDPQNALLWCALGQTQLQRDTPGKALESLQKALTLEPNLLTARVAQGLAHLREGQPALAETDLTTALQARPNTPQWLRIRGAIRMMLGKNDAMCEDFINACTRGDCEGLAEARRRQLCLPDASPAHATPPPNATPASPASTPDEADMADKVSDKPRKAADKAAKKPATPAKADENANTAEGRQHSDGAQAAPRSPQKKTPRAAVPDPDSPTKKGAEKEGLPSKEGASVEAVPSAKDAPQPPASPEPAP